MPVWKVLLTGLFACICLALATLTVVIPLEYEGGKMWLSLGGMIVATAVAGGLFALFLRSASASLDVKTHGYRR